MRAKVTVLALIVSVFICANPVVYAMVGCPCDHSAMVAHCCASSDNAQDCCMDAQIPLPDAQLSSVALIKLPIYSSTLDYTTFDKGQEVGLSYTIHPPPKLSSAVQRPVLQTWRL